MKILNLKQGTPEWEKHRLTARNASEAGPMIGESKTVSRRELLDQKSTGVAKEYSDWVKDVLFARGHAVEAPARALAEKQIGQPLYPVVATDDEEYLSASYDGLTLDKSKAFECKQWSEDKARYIRKHRKVPPEDYWQVIQQIAVGANKVLYAVTDGTEQNFEYIWVTADKDELSQLRTGWKQFDEDLLSHTVEQPETQATGQAPPSLPALRVEINGSVTATNVREFRKTALALIDNVPELLQTDQDFADAESATKWCGEVENRCKAAKDHALSQTADIYETLQLIDDISSAARDKRLALGKLVKGRKEAIRREIVSAAQSRIREIVSDIESGLDGARLKMEPVNFAGAIKGKRSVDSIRDACDDLLTQARIALHEQANVLRKNLDYFRGIQAPEHLFPDLVNLVHREYDGFVAIVDQRVARHEQQVAAAAEKAAAEKAAAEKAAAEKAAAEKAAERAPEQPATANSTPEPAITSQEPPPRARVASEPQRPNDKDIVNAICQAYGVSFSTAVRWLRSMNLTRWAQTNTGETA